MPSPHVNECLPVPLSEAEGFYFANDVKKKATNSTEPMKQMFEKARNAFIARSNSSIEEIALSLPKFNQIKKTLYQKKHQDMPILPDSLASFDLVNPLYNLTSYRKRFLLYDSFDTKRFLVLFVRSSA